jgi:hypothetical protein
VTVYLRYNDGFLDPIHWEEHDVERQVLLLRAEEEIVRIDEPKEQVHKGKKPSDIVQQMKGSQHSNHLYRMFLLNLSPEEQNHLCPKIDENPPIRCDA